MQTMSVSLHFRKTAPKEEVGRWFADSLEGNLRLMHNSGTGPLPPCTGWVPVNGSAPPTGFCVTMEEGGNAVEVTAGDPVEVLQEQAASAAEPKPPPPGDAEDQRDPKTDVEERPYSGTDGDKGDEAGGDGGQTKGAEEQRQGGSDQGQYGRTVPAEGGSDPPWRRPKFHDRRPPGFGEEKWKGLSRPEQDAAIEELTLAGGAREEIRCDRAYRCQCAAPWRKTARWNVRPAVGITKRRPRQR